METAALSNSLTKELGDYQKSRLPPTILLPLTAFLCSAVAAVAWPSSWADWAANGILAFLVVVQLRLWDDLASVEADRRHSPERVLCKAKSLRGFWIVLVLLSLINTTLLGIFKNVNSVTVYQTIMAFLAVWYSLLSRFTRDPIFCSLVVLIKYPGIVVLLSVQNSAGVMRKMAYAAALTFLCFCVYEILHDRRLRATQSARHWLLVLLAALFLVGAFLSGELIFVARSAALLQAVLIALGACVLWQSGHSARTSENSNLSNYAVFFVGFSWLLNYALAS
jgi:hypothetical protein